MYSDRCSGSLFLTSSYADVLRNILMLFFALNSVRRCSVVQVSIFLYMALSAFSSYVFLTILVSGADFSGLILLRFKLVLDVL